MYQNEDKEFQEIEAIKLIDQAENLADKGKGDDAIKLYERAAQIYLDMGSYLKLDELFIRIIHIISQFKNHIQATYRLKSIIRKTEELKLYEITANLLNQLGNLSFRMQDWETAGESWMKAADYLIKSDPDHYLIPASEFYLQAGQAYERSYLTKDLGKQLILKAVMKLNKFDELYRQIEKQAQSLLSNKEFKAAADKFIDIANHFRKALNNLEELLQGIESEDIKINAKARIIHFVAEYQTLSAICLTATNNLDFNEKISNLGYDSIKLFENSISLLKDYLFQIKKDFDKEIVLRVTFDTMLLAIIQKVLNVEELVCSEFLFKNIEENKALIKELENSPYFKIVKKIEKFGLTDTLDNLKKVNLGHFEKIKNDLVSHFLSLIS
jgi:tetratricopeptide (TPR) repeat protein